MADFKTLKALAAAAGAGVLAFALAGCSLTGSTAPAGDHGITVTASSEAKVVPDKARISVSVVSEAKTAEQAQTQNAETTNAVIAAIQALGVADESIQTSYSDLSPRYGSRTSDDGKDDDVAYDEWVITGYEMNTQLQISDLDIDNVGAIVQACVAAGANDTNGVEYYASDYDSIYNDALSAALDTARAKAESIASSSGVGLGKVTNVTEGYQDTSYRYSSVNTMAMEDAAADSGAMAKTMPGQVGIEANVTVTYAIS